MKISARIMLLLLGVTLIVSEPHALAHIDVTVQQARELIESTNDLTVVDVRERYEYCDARGHIPGSADYPWSSVELQARYGKLPADGPVLAVCRSGGRSNAAAGFLDSKGFPEVYDMLAGMNAWQWETADCKYSGGAGTADDPYQITAAVDLITLGETPEDYDKHFILKADIDLDLPGRRVFDKAIVAPDTNGAEDGFQGTPFAGAFDGNGHTISRLTITGGDYVGLFGYLAFGADIKDLGVVDLDVSGSGREIGGLVGNNDGHVTNCHSIATVSGLEGVGGLIGGNYGVVSNCHSAAVVWSAERVGGLMGRNSGVVITCYSTGTVSGTWQAGGLLGVNNGIVTNCCSTATVYGDAGLGPWLDEGVFGGLTACNLGEITNCYATGSVSGKRYVGGLVGRNWRSMSSCYSTATVSGDADVGGLVGSGGDETNCFWDTEASGLADSGGTGGLNTEAMGDVQTYLDTGWDFMGEIQNGFNEIWQMPEGGGYPVLGAFSGYIPPQLPGKGTPEDPHLISAAMDLGTVYYNPGRCCKLAASIDLSGITWSAAALPAFAGVFDGNGQTIENLTISGKGLIGLFGWLQKGSQVKNLGVVDANIAGVDYENGILAGCNLGSIDNCYSTATVTGDVQIGGLGGRNEGSISHCCSAGTVAGNTDVGGLLGHSRGDVTGCFWDIQTSGLTNGVGGTGKTTSEMQTPGTFLETGWDFIDETANGTDDIWWILDGQDYPRLWWEVLGEN